MIKQILLKHTINQLEQECERLRDDPDRIKYRDARKRLLLAQAELLMMQYESQPQG